MDAALSAVLWLAQQNADVGGRGDNPDDGTGVITIVIIAALVLVGGALLALFFVRGRTRRRALERHPDRAGHVGRIGPSDG